MSNQAYSSVVEHTAHNGFVVGSIPTRPKMKFSAKDYATSKTKKYIKTNSLFFFFHGVNQNYKDWLITEQNLKSINFSYYKVFNKKTNEALKNSIFKTIQSIIKSITFLIKPIYKCKQISKKTLLNNFEPLLFVMLIIKLNNKIYKINQIKTINSFNYDKNKLILFQFNVSNSKINNQKSK